MVVTLATKVYATCTGALYVKFLTATIIQGRKTYLSGNRPPEDFPIGKNLPKQTYGLNQDPNDEKLMKAVEVEKRWRRLILNDLESIPLALLVFGSAVMTGTGNEMLQVSTMISYTASRYLHMYAYAKKLQPQRSIYWITGVLSVLLCASNTTYSLYFY